LNWKLHTSKVSLMISKNIGVINRVKNILPHSALVNLYNTLIHLYLLYCNIVWGTTSLLALKRLVVLQKRVLGIISNSYFRAHCSPLFRNLNILKSQNIHVLQNCCIYV